MHSHFLWSHPAEAKQTNSPPNLSEFIHLLNANQNKLVTLNKHQRRVIWNTCFQCTISVWTYPNLYLGFCACMNYLKQGKSEGFDSCDRPSNLKLDSNRQFFPLCDREIWWMTSKNSRAPLLYYVKLCASFQIHWWIQTGFTVQKRSIRFEIGDMLSRVTLKLDGWPWKTIGHLFYATSSFEQHFVAIGEFKLELQSGNAQSGSNSTIFRAVRPWNLTDDLAKQ